MARSELLNAGALIGKLQVRGSQLKNRPVPHAVVGYSAHYAVYVHEDLSVTHRNGQAKFLEQPARTMRRELSDLMAGMLRRKVPLDTAILFAAYRLLYASQELVPVDTGFLRMSGFARLEKVD